MTAQPETGINMGLQRAFLHQERTPSPHKHHHHHHHRDCPVTIYSSPAVVSQPARRGRVCVCVSCRTLLSGALLGGSWAAAPVKTLSTKKGSALLVRIPALDMLLALAFVKPLQKFWIAVLKLSTSDFPQHTPSLWTVRMRTKERRFTLGSARLYHPDVAT